MGGVVSRVRPGAGTGYTTTTERGPRWLKRRRDEAQDEQGEQGEQAEGQTEEGGSSVLGTAAKGAAAGAALGAAAGAAQHVISSREDQGDDAEAEESSGSEEQASADDSDA